MRTFSNLLVCEHCDAVYSRQPLEAGEVASCTQCLGVLYRGRRLTVDGWLALTIAAAVAFVIANVYPVVIVNLRGMYNNATLWQSVDALAQGGAAPIALPTAMVVILVPALQIGLLGWVLVFARLQRRAPGFARVMRLLVALRPWNMIEVCLLGILVAVIKLSSLAQVLPGPGIWAMAALVVLTTVICSRDLQPLWALTDRANRVGEVGR